MTRNGILCLESDWDEGLKRRRSLVPVLDLLKSQWKLPYIHRTASTREEFRRVISEWTKSKYQAFPILYLGVHGSPGAIDIGDEQIPLRDLYEFTGKGRGRVVHFGSCETLSASKTELDGFLKRTQLTAISGFRTEVDWLHSCALEILVLDLLSARRITPRNITAFQKQLQRMAGTLVRTLGFHVWQRSALSRR
jgi:hypothetical protein